MEKVVIPELKQILFRLTSDDELPEKEQRTLRFLTDARVYWGWNTRNPSELFALLMEVNNPAASNGGIKLATLQSSGALDPRGIRQMLMQAWHLAHCSRE